jgi:hypothetical protein
MTTATRDINDFDGLTVSSSHGSPWKYDAFVPIEFARNGLKPQTIFREVETVDIALTLSQYIRVKSAFWGNRNATYSNAQQLINFDYPGFFEKSPSRYIIKFVCLRFRYQPN